MRVRPSFLAVSSAMLLSCAPASEQLPSVAITHVTVIDMTGAPPRPDQTVIIQGNRIVSVGEGAPPKGAELVEGRGKFLVPGFWDMHVHTTVPGGEALLSLYVANGATGVRDMNDSFPAVSAWRERIAAGSLVGPRIVASGPYREGGAVPIPHIVVRTPEAGRAAVDWFSERLRRRRTCVAEARPPDPVLPRRLRHRRSRARLQAHRRQRHLGRADLRRRVPGEPPPRHGARLGLDQPIPLARAAPAGEDDDDDA